MNTTQCNCAGCERQRLNLGGYQPCANPERRSSKDNSERGKLSPPKKP